MKRAFLFIISFILLVGLVGCSKSSKQDVYNTNTFDKIYGTYTFEKASYLSPLSSNMIEALEKEMAGKKFTIQADIFKAELRKDKAEIDSPQYVKEEIPKATKSFSDVRSFIGKKIDYQYTIYTKDGEKTNWRLYISSDSLWISSFADNTSDGSEIIMYIYKLSKDAK